MSDPLYRRDVLRLAADAHGAGHLAGPHVTGHAYNSACGDRITVQLVLAGDRIAKLTHETNACVLAQASASILGNVLQGATLADIERLRANVKSMLMSESPPPPEPFDAYAVFEGAVEYQSRHRCVLLPFDALLDAFR